MRTVFMGTPAFAVPSLEALREVSEIVAVVCQPDRPRDRGLQAEPPPVKARALELGLPVHQPTKLRTGEFAAWLRGLEVDLALVVAYGRILNEEVLRAPRLGCFNVHASILPRYRGAAPILWAIVRGETETGVTLMQMDAGMDTGAIVSLHRTPIGPDETTGALTARLSELGRAAVHADLPRIETLRAAPQDHALATTAPMLKKQDGAIDFSASALAVHNHIRGMNPWPGAFTQLHGRTLKVHTSTLSAFSGTPGQVVLADKTRLVVACGSGSVELTRVQVEGKRAVSGGDFVLGRGCAEGDQMSTGNTATTTS
jgi:methionyl-tRNA formyltransferase